MTRSALAAAVAAIALLAAAPHAVPSAQPARQLDSQLVLQRYALALDGAVEPKTVIFTYSVSQAGPANLEQRHVIYRSGLNVRDETLAVDGVALRQKQVRFSRRDDRYAISRMAPRALAYQFLFVGLTKVGHHFDYTYEATPLVRSGAAWVDRMTIDGVKFLPTSIHFHTSGPEAAGTADVQYAAFGKYWMPVQAQASALVAGKSARERITWSDYRFPESLPPSTFQPPKPLPVVTLPPV